ncbi:MAG: hypothetical protein ACI9LX_004578, partial [Paraglaciecola sp.]
TGCLAQRTSHREKKIQLLYLVQRSLFVLCGGKPFLSQTQSYSAQGS